MKAYPKYKESNVEWFGTIPSHWGTVPLKYVCYMKGRIGWQGLTQAEFRDEGPYLITGMNFKKGKMNWDECYHISQERYDEAPEIHVQEGDVLITKDGTIGKLLFMDYLPGPTSLNSHLLILRPRNDEFTTKYLYYLLHSDAFLRFVDNVKTGTTFYGITQASMGDFRMLVFDKKEQQAIADFLDRKTAQIDTLIEKKQRQIDLLHEQRTALINHAVTKGLNPNVKMKDSGVEWLGGIPSHWNLAKVKYVCNVKGRIGFRGYTTEDQVSEGEGALTLGATHITSKGVIDLSSPVFISWEKYYESPEIMVNQNDILVVQRGSTCGKVGFIENEIGQATINPSLVILKEHKIDSKYLFYSLSSKLVEYQFSPTISKTAIPMLSQEQIGNFSILLPEESEQKKIVDFLDKQQIEFDKGTDIIIRQIEVLREYRTALISEAVTGKIDVR